MIWTRGAFTHARDTMASAAINDLAWNDLNANDLFDL